MIPKLVACAEAVEGGVGSAVMLDGRAEHSLLIELFTDQGIGTMVCAADKRPLGVCAADKRPLGVCAADRKR
jgi:hypothetical protein